MQLKNVGIIVSALALNILFFLVLVFMNSTLDLKNVNDTLHPIEILQIQPKEPKIIKRKKAGDKPIEKIKKKKLKLKPVSLDLEKMKPRKIRTLLNIDIQPTLGVSGADLTFQENYFSSLSPNDRDMLGLDEVDEPPRKIYHVKPAYPYFARVNRIEGEVALQFLVDENGDVSDVEVIRFSGYDGFCDAAIRAVMKWRFKPATYFAQPAAVWCIQKISFRLEGLY